MNSVETTNAILIMASNRNHLIRPMKLQKLLYFSTGYYAVDNEGAWIVDDDFRAWPYGPVIPKIYDIFKKFGSKPITNFIEPINKSIDCPVYEMIEYVLDCYLHDTDIELSEKTHVKTGPWYKTVSSKGYGAIIPKDGIIEHCRSLWNQELE